MMSTVRSLKPMLTEVPVMVSTWIFGWWSLLQMCRKGCIGPYMLALTLAVHFRFPAPLGQLPPFPDMMVAYVHALSVPLSILCLVVAVSWRSDSETFLWWIGAAVLSVLAARRKLLTSSRLHETFEAVGVDLSARPARPRRPLVTWLNPYLYCGFSNLAGRFRGERVRIRRVRTEAMSEFVDVWSSDAKQSPDTEERSSLRPGVAGTKHRGRPVLFFIHGGGWKGGGARCSPQAPLLQSLAAQGWFVVSCEYRKERWPQHLDDAEAALRWACGPAAARMGADASKLVIAGTSAGGHIASLLVLRATSLHICPCGVCAVLLFYPAVDPTDMTGVTVHFPLKLPILRTHAGQSLMSWYFERFVLHDDIELWPSAEPLARMQDRVLAGRSWPPTLIVHGDRDGVVPPEHSRRLLDMLSAQDGSGTLSTNMRKCDGMIVVPGARHAYEIAPCTIPGLVFDGVAMWLNQHLPPSRPAETCTMRIVD